MLTVLQRVYAGKRMLAEISWRMQAAVIRRRRPIAAWIRIDGTAIDICGKAFRRDRLRRTRRTIGNGIELLVLGQPVEERGDACRGGVRQQLPEWLFDRVRDQRGTLVQIANEPSLHHAVNEWNRGVGERGQRHQQRNKKSQRQSHG